METTEMQMTVSEARQVLQEALQRMPEEICGWPRHILHEGADADVIRLATLLKRGEN